MTHREETLEAALLNLLPLAEKEAESRRLIARALLTEQACAIADQATAAVIAARLLLDRD